MKTFDVDDLIDLIIEKISNYPVFEQWFDLDEETQERYKTDLKEAIYEWKEEDDDLFLDYSS